MPWSTYLSTGAMLCDLVIAVRTQAAAYHAASLYDHEKRIHGLCTAEWKEQRLSIQGKYIFYVDFIVLTPTFLSVMRVAFFYSDAKYEKYEQKNLDLFKALSCSPGMASLGLDASKKQVQLSPVLLWHAALITFSSRFPLSCDCVYEKPQTNNHWQKTLAIRYIF